MLGDKIEKTTDNVRGWKVGDTVKTFDGAFNTCIILGFELVAGDWWACVVRPYCYAHDVGTSRAYPLTGFETYKINVNKLQRHETRNFRIADPFVDEHRGERT